MDIWNNLTEKSTEAGQKTMQKIKGVSKTSKYNYMISEEEKKIDNYYYQIGKIYVSMHRENYENEFSGLFVAIEQSENNIKEYRKQIMEIKGILRCEKCGETILKGSAFCSSCGAQVPQIEVSNGRHEVKCKKCGTFMSSEMRFCTVCGTEMKRNNEQVFGEMFKTDEIKTDKCRNCGAEYDEEAIFCIECGMRLKR